MAKKVLKAWCPLCGYSINIEKAEDIKVTSRGQPYVFCGKRYTKEGKTYRGKSAVFLKRSDVKEFLKGKRGTYAAKIMKIMTAHEAKRM